MEGIWRGRRWALGARQRDISQAFLYPPGITLTNHPMNKTSASLSLDYL